MKVSSPPDDSTLPKQDPKTIEDILKQLGGFGKFQALILFLITILEIPAACMFFQPFITASIPPEWTCNNNTILTQNLCSCNGTLKSTGSTIVSEWNLICDLSWVADFISTIQMIGMLLGSPVFGPLADWYGRKYTYLAGNLCMAIGSILSAAAPDPFTYAGGRFLTGVGFSGFVNLGSSFAMEFVPPNARALCSAVGLLGEGIMLLGLLGYFFENNWRYLVWVSTALSSIILITFPFIPESPRWLMRNNKLDEAAKIFKRMADMNGKPPVDQDVIKTVAHFEQENATHTKAQIGCLEFLKDKSLRLTTLCLMVITSIISLTMYGISFNIKNLGGNLNLNVALLGLCDVIGHPISFVFNYLLTRRRTLALFMTISSCFCIAAAVVHLMMHVNDKAIWILVFCMFGKFAASGARASAKTVCGESFPTNVRNIGTGIVWTAPGFVGIWTPLMAYLGLQWPSVPLFVLAVGSLIGASVSFLLKETKGIPLQE